MKAVRASILAAALSLGALPAGAAGTPPASPPSLAPQATSVPVDTPAPAPVPTEAPRVPVDTPEAQPTDSSIDVQGEGSSPVLAPTAVPPPATGTGPVTGPGATQGQGSTTGSSSQTTTTSQSPISPTGSSGSTGTSGTSSSTSSTSLSSGVTLPPTVSNSDPISAIIGVNQAAYAAPSQLTCSKKDYPISQPFLVSPYGGWTTINSFLDHDSPDYAVDGTIVVANGMKATSADGVESDAFPGYWSPALRQYINYDGHNGYDFGISYQPVYAAAAGSIEYAGWDGGPTDGYGQMILINHHNGYVTLYGHLSQLQVKQGQHVEAGQQIGISGSTGNSSGPHLHFSVFHNCQVTDPYGWTGSGSDPLYSFDQEKAAYLWLPGHDPLVLNPPPDWPTYPLGLHLNLATEVHVGKRVVPPADRLILLRLPNPSGDLSSGAALARTDALIDQEAQVVRPYLDELRAEGLIESYQLIPAAAAIWVRGTVDAATLESLPGVASLSGVTPLDVAAAQQGLAHSVLIQVGSRQAPSLWPLGFRSALHTWRPVITALAGHALVEGFAQPGSAVNATLVRSRKTVASALGQGDAQTGGFVVTLHDRIGQPVVVLPGDTVEVQVGRHVASVDIPKTLVRAHPDNVVGTAAPGAALETEVLGPKGTPLWTTESTANHDGAFSMTLRHQIMAGSMAVVSSIDAAGDQEAVGADVPGFVIDEGRSIVSGWSINPSPTLQVWRNGKEVLSRRVPVSVTGTFRMVLADHPLQPHDIVSIGSRWRRHSVVLPAMDLAAREGSTQLTVSAPPGSGLTVLSSAGGRLESRGVHIGSSGRSVLAIARYGAGDMEEMAMQTPGGDTIERSIALQAVVPHIGTDVVRGTIPARTTVTVRLWKKGKILGHGIAEADGQGQFMAVLRDAVGMPVHIEPGMAVTAANEGGEMRSTIPAMQFVQRGKVVVLQARGGSSVQVVRGSASKTVRVGSGGEAMIGAPGTIRVLLSGDGGFTFERTFNPTEKRADHTEVGKRGAKR